MSKVYKKFQIGDKNFEIRYNPSLRQKIGVIEHLKSHEIDYQRATELGMKLETPGATLTDAETYELALIGTVAATNADFITGLASNMLIEEGKSYKESYDANKELIADWMMDAEDTDGIDMATFFGLMRGGIKPDKTDNQNK